jgi:hypothetical protein
MTNRYTVDTDLRDAMKAQGFTCCVLDHNTSRMGVTTAAAYCFYVEDAERIAAALNEQDAMRRKLLALQEAARKRVVPWPFPTRAEIKRSLA